MIVIIAGIALLPLIHKRSKRIILTLLLALLLFLTSFIRYEDGAFMLVDKFKHKGILIIEKRIGIVIDDGISVLLWKDVLTRKGVKYIDVAYLNSINGARRSGFFGISDFCYVKVFNLPEEWKKNPLVKELLDKIKRSGSKIEFRKDKKGEIIYRNRKIELQH